MKTRRKIMAALRCVAALLVLAAAGAGCDLHGAGGRGAAGRDSIAIMTWNVQLLFDGVEEGTEFREFREAAGWSREKYLGRVNVIARAIGEMERVPDIIALQEVESAQVVADLAAALSAHRYRWTHFARIPGMSLGVGLLSRYPLEGARAHSVYIDGDTAPRPMLEARVNMPGRARALAAGAGDAGSAGATGSSGDAGSAGVTGSAGGIGNIGSADGEDGADEDGFSLLLFVCHWKSKRGGADETESTRRASARIILRRMRELAQTNPSLPVIVIGDLNVTHDEFVRGRSMMMRSLMPDEPRAAEFALQYALSKRRSSERRSSGRPSAERHFGAGVSALELQQDFIVISHNKPPEARHFPDGVLALYSPWTVEKEDGSFFFRNSWETIDHFLLSAQLFDGFGWEFCDSRVINVPPFASADGLPNAYNPRTGRGISDHLPLMLFLRMAESTTPP